MRSASLLTVIACGALAAPLAQARAQDSEASAPEGHPARQLGEQIVGAFNRADPTALAEMFAPQAELVDEEGNRYLGREEIAGVFSRFFEQYPGATIAKEIGEVRLVGPGLAVEDGVITFATKDAADSARNLYTAVKVLLDDRWVVASLRQSAEDDLPTPREQLEPLAWLVGEWVGEGPEEKVHLSYRWSEDGNFLLGRYTVEGAGPEPLRTDQRLGWDGAHQAIRSWNFDSDGGISEGHWSTDGSSWIVRSEITLPDGLTGSATFYLTPIDENKFLWSTVDRVVGGVAQPALELTLVREPPRPAEAVTAGITDRPNTGGSTMNRDVRRYRALALAALFALAGLGIDSEAFGQRGGRGGGRAGGMGGRVGGGGGGMGTIRPSMARPGGMARPSLPSAGGHRPTTRPSFGAGGGARPSMPAGGSRPSLPSNRPQLPNTRPNIPGASSRPSPLPSRPSLPDRPGGINRPDIGSGNRPNAGNIGNRPNIGIGGDNRPSLSNVTNRPNFGDRTNIGIGDRTNIGGIGDRTNIGISNNRPVIGGDRTNIGGGNRTNIGSGNRTNIANINRNNIGINVNRPGAGWGGGGAWGGNYWGVGGRGPGWSNTWYNRHVPNRYHGWYHGSWNNAWANTWGVPLAYGASAWALGGLSTWTSGFYGAAYENPYYVAPVAAIAPVYDYSQPIVIQASAAPADDPSGTPPAEPQASPEQQQSAQLFDQARASFAANDFSGARDLVEQALRLTPDDSVMHEFRALCLFALGDYQGAAAALNALLAVAPGWDWTTMISLYGGNSSLYTDQLRNLETYTNQNPDDPASHFVLAYHYLICGHTEAAIEALEVVTRAQPRDEVAARMLQALTGTASTQAAAATPPPPDADPGADPAAPTTDLAGRWLASPNGQVSFDLSIGEDGSYTWISTPSGKEPTTLAGQYQIDGDVLVLANAEQGNLSGQVTSEGPDRFRFVPTGAPPGDPGLTFNRHETQ